MPLELSQIQAILKDPKRNKEIKQAVLQENKIKFHVETNVFPDFTIANEFLSWVQTLIPKDKYQTFLSLFQVPISTNELTEQIFQELSKIFESKNSNFEYNFTDKKWKEDYLLYKEKFLNLNKRVKSELWEAFKLQYNSIVICDLPQEQKAELPEPYFYLLPISNVIDIATKENEILYIIFKQPDNVLAVIDEKNYYLFKVDDNYTKIISEITISEHNLGYCPARFFWNINLNSKSDIVKKSIFSNQLSSLNWYLFYSLSKKHLDLYAGYPIVSAYEQQCDFVSETTRDYCDGGFIKNSAGNYKINGQGILEPCPVCSQRRLHGAGSYIEIPIPTAEQPDIKDPVKITTIDINSLNYNTSELERLRKEIFSNIVGYGGEANNDQAINEKQVTSNYESRKNILIEIKTQFEQLQAWIEHTISKLRYDVKYINNSINYGTEFYLYTITDLQQQYKQLKESGISEIELENVFNQILETENKNNKHTLQRSNILRDLEPLRHKTLTDIISLKNAGLINDDEAKLKINFTKYIDVFERENGSVVDFASNKEYYDKINIILTKLKDYVKSEATTSEGK